MLKKSVKAIVEHTPDTIKKAALCHLVKPCKIREAYILLLPPITLLSKNFDSIERKC